MPVGRQKLLGLVKPGKNIDESLPLGCMEQADLSLNFSMDGRTIFCSMIGAPDSEHLSESLYDEHCQAVHNSTHCCGTSTEKFDTLCRVYDSAQFSFIEPPRDGKKLLVLDLDVCSSVLALFLCIFLNLEFMCSRSSNQVDACIAYIIRLQ